MESIWNTITHVLSTMPAWLAAILVGWAISFGFAQAFKKYALPISWDPSMRALVTRVLAGTTAFVPAAAYMIEHNEPGVVTALAAVGAALWSPMAAAMLQAILKRFAPWLADALSGDVRGAVHGPKAENRR